MSYPVIVIISRLPSCKPKPIIHRPLNSLDTYLLFTPHVARYSLERRDTNLTNNKIIFISFRSLAPLLGEITSEHDFFPEEEARLRKVVNIIFMIFLLDLNWCPLFSFDCSSIIVRFRFLLFILLRGRGSSAPKIDGTIS
jgi:hypothetical protein